MEDSLKKYNVKVDLSLLVEAKNRKSAKNAVNDIPWDEIVDFAYPRAGFIREFRINGDTGKVVSARQK